MWSRRCCNEPLAGRPAPSVRFTLNGKPCEGEAEPRLLLTDFLRHQARRDRHPCRLRTRRVRRLHRRIDGEPARACLTLAVQVDGCEVRTVEGLAPAPDRLGVLQAAFSATTPCNAASARPGILMSLDCFLREHPGRTRRPFAIC